MCIRDSPCDQGCVQALGVFLDTIVICTLTGFVVVMGRVWLTEDSAAWFELGKLDRFLASCGALTGNGTIYHLVTMLVSVCFGLFAFTCLVGFMSFTEMCANRISTRPAFINTIRVLCLVVISFGVITNIAGMDLSESSYVELLSGIRQKNQTGIQESAKLAGLTEAQSELLCSIPFLYGTMDETLNRAKEMAQNDEMRRDAEDLQAYCEALKNLGYGDKIQLELSLVNDIDYYNGVIFRGYIRKLPGCVLAGGQYDKAMKILGKAGGAVGFAIYLDELTKGTQDPQRYDVDAVLLYSEKDEITDVFMAVCALQEKGMSVSAQTSEDTELRYREKYVLRDGRPEMEAK